MAHMIVNPKNNEILRAKTIKLNILAPLKVYGRVRSRSDTMPAESDQRWNRRKKVRKLKYLFPC